MKKKSSLIIAIAALACSSAHAGNLIGDTYNDNRVTNAPTAIANGGSAKADATGIGIAGASATIQRGAVQVDNRNTNLNANINANKNVNKNTNVNKLGQGQSQRTENANNSRLSVDQNFEAEPYLPGMITADSQGPRNPNLQLNAEIRMLTAAEAEIAATSGKGLTSVYTYSDDGVTAVVAYSASAYTVHVYPSGSAKGITPAVLERVAIKAVSKIKAKTFGLSVQYLSIENHSNGTGAGVSGSSSLANADRGLVGGVAAAVTGNRGRTSERVRIELVYVGQR